MKLRELEEDRKDANKEIQSIKDFFKSQRDQVNFEKLDKEISSTYEFISKLNDQIDSIKSAKKETIKKSSGTQDKEDEIRKCKKALVENRNELSLLELEDEDTKEFLHSINERLQAIEDSLSVDSIIGKLSECPLCEITLEELDNKPYCKASERHLKGDLGKSSILKMRDELKFQIKESKRLSSSREIKKAELKSRINALNKKLIPLQKELASMLKDNANPRDEKLGALHQLKGNSEAKIEYLNKLKQFFDLLLTYQDRAEKLSIRIFILNTKIKNLRRDQEKRRQKSKELVDSFLIEILKKDTGNESSFSRVESIDINYKANTYYLNERNNFSASSNALLKNSIHFALLFASVKDAKFRYPRLLLCDNIEDKGMQDKRSQNFQRGIRELCDQFNNKGFQVIFSTSMIDPSLEDSKYCVGRHFTIKEKSLEF